MTKGLSSELSHIEVCRMKKVMGLDGMGRKISKAARRRLSVSWLRRARREGFLGLGREEGRLGRRVKPRDQTSRICVRVRISNFVALRIWHRLR